MIKSPRKNGHNKPYLKPAAASEETLKHLLKQLWLYRMKEPKMPFIQPREILFFLAREPTRSNLSKAKAPL